MNKKEMLEKTNRLIKMFNDVESGKRVVCPVCGKGIMEAQGPQIKCSNDQCNARYTTD